MRARQVALVVSDYDPNDCSPPCSSFHGDSPGKNTGMGCHFLLQGIFLIQESNPHLLHWQADSLPLSHLLANRQPGKSSIVCFKLLRSLFSLCSLILPVHFPHLPSHCYYCVAVSKPLYSDYSTFQGRGKGIW